MTILRVYDDAGVLHYLDLYDSEPIKLTYNFNDIQDIGTNVSNFSRTFRVPATELNIKLFGNWFNVNLEGTFNPKRKYTADVSWSTLPQMSGHIKLNNCYISDGKYSDFEVIFFGETSTVAREIGDDKLWDLNISELNHGNTYTNVINSINSSIVGLPVNAVRYSLVDKGQNFSEIGGVGTRPISSTAQPLYAGDFTPMVQVKWLFAKILSEAGFSFESNFINNDIDNIYLLYYNGLTAPTLTQLTQENNYNVGVTTNQTVTIYDAQEVHAVLNQSETAPFFDGNNNITLGPPITYFTSPYYGVFSFDIWMTIENTSDQVIHFRPVLYDVNTGLILAAAVYMFNTEPGETRNYQYNGFSRILSEGQEVALGFQSLWDENGAQVIVLSSAAPDQDNGTGWKLYASTALAGGTVDMTLNAPDYKQIDFIRDLTKMFNLVFVPSKDDPKNIIIEPFATWLASGNTIDWTEKIDLSKNITLSPTTDLQSRNLELTYAKDGDVLNTAIQEIGSRTYGRMLVDNAENDFATGDKKIETYCSPTPNNAIQGTGIIIPKLINEEGTGIVCRPRILHWAKIDTSTNIKVLNEATVTVNTINYYPFAGHYSTPNAEVTTFDLNFGPETPFHNIIATPYRTLFNLYWRSYINQIYSSSARIMKAHFYLNSVDILTLQFNERIFIKDTYWRINKIQDYGVGVDALTMVELVKVLDIEVDPLYIPHDQNDDGSIEFVDWGGSLSAGTEYACEQFGYEWDGVKCFSKQPITVYSPLGSNNKSGAGNAPGIVGSFGNVATPAGLTQTSIIGQDHTISEGAFRTVHGFSHTVAQKVDAHVFGNRALANWSGLHLGGRWWNECGIDDELAGRAQWGVILLMAEGDLSTNGNSIEFFLEGINNNRLVLPDDSLWNVEINIAFYDLNTATQNLVGQQSMNYLLCLSKTGGLAATTGTPSTTLREIGTYSTKFELAIDVATDTTQHRLSLMAISGAGLPVYGVKATAAIKYTMVKSICVY